MLQRFWEVRDLCMLHLEQLPIITEEPWEALSGVYRLNWVYHTEKYAWETLHSFCWLVEQTFCSLYFPSPNKHHKCSLYEEHIVGGLFFFSLLNMLRTTLTFSSHKEIIITNLLDQQLMFVSTHPIWSYMLWGLSVKEWHLMRPSKEVFYCRHTILSKVDWPVLC